MPRPPVLGYLQSAVSDNTAHSQMDKLLFEDEMSNIQPEWGTMREEQEGYDPVMEFAEGMIPIGGVLKSLKGVKGSRTLLDDALSKYGKKAHNQIRELIDYDRAIAMDIPEKSHFLQRGISRMFRVVEPDKKKVQRLEDLWTMEDWEEFTEPLMKRTSNLLKGKGTKGMQQGGPAERTKQWSQEDLLDLVNLGEQEYKDALTFWGRDTTLFDSLKQDIADTNIIVQELPETDKRLEPRAGGRYARGPYSKSPDLPFHPEGKANPEAVKDTIFVRGAMGSEKYPSESREEVLAHEFGHYFEPHYPGEKMLSWIKNPIDAFRYFARRHNPGLASYSGEQLKKHIKELEESGEFDDILRTPTSQITFNEMFFPIGTKYQLAKAKEKAEAMKEAGYKLPEGLQQGVSAERAPLLGYMNPAVQDETAHSQMDRLMFENELEQQPQHSMRTYQQGYDPAMEWGEGMMPIGGMLRGGKGTLAMLKHSYGPYAKQSAHYRDILDKKLMNILKKYESQTRGRNIEKSLSTGAGQEATKEAMETDYIIQKLGGKYTN